MTGPVATDKLRRKIAELDDLSRPELVQRWQKAHGCLPPKGIKRGLLLRSAAWHLQARHLGGLKGDVKRALRKLIKAEVPTRDKSRAAGSSPDVTRIGESPARLRRRLVPGTRLVREWQGRLHVVEVVEDGFLHDGKTYRSLSAVARRITGAQWSGPRFFGQ
ncbi:DUF2924 domain-containing protein [Oceanibacterium hippocampi]|uniref:DUF2924 domain-containing protein n=1 Tax=Oceanibacterium hippocampi TaxID=745714 RepID=A0A1Y5TVU7_9PROT|nr:DUF2924 domain-containing protein [Oceanibacterium hippocampi]SLN74224.1 hypothetical protein OCH7691_03711 [Oceanibacterium hippocampi]